MKAKLPLKTTFRLALQGKTVTKVLTVFLSAVSFLLFAVTSMGYLFSRRDYIARAYYHRAETQGYVAFAGNGSYAPDKAMEGEALESLQTKTGISFVYEADAGVSGWTHFVEGEVPASLLQLGGMIGSLGLAGGAEDYAAIGFTLLAGEYPSAANEVAVSELHFQALQAGGYVDASKQFVWVEDEGGGRFEFNDDLTAGERFNVSSYEDILGKRLGNGDPAADSRARVYTIVGVVDTHSGEERLEEATFVSLRTHPAAHLLFSEEHQAQEQTIVFGGIEDKGMMRRVVDYVLDARENEGGEGKFAAPLDYTTLLPDESRTDEWYIGVVGGAAGGVLLIFSVLLCWHQATAALRLKEKKIGILRSMGATGKDISRLMTCETLLIGAAIFLLSLLGTVLLYYLWLAPATVIGSFGVSIFVFNGWTVLILAALSFAVPFLCTIVPVKKFLKQSIVDNISGNSRRR